MGGMGLIFTPVLVRRLMGPPGLFRPMNSTSRTHSYSKQSNWMVYSNFLSTLNAKVFPSNVLPYMIAN